MKTITKIITAFSLAILAVGGYGVVEKQIATQAQDENKLELPDRAYLDLLKNGQQDLLDQVNLEEEVNKIKFDLAHDLLVDKKTPAYQEYQKEIAQEKKEEQEKQEAQKKLVAVVPEEQNAVSEPEQPSVEQVATTPEQQITTAQTTDQNQVVQPQQDLTPETTTTQTETAPNQAENNNNGSNNDQEVAPAPEAQTANTEVDNSKPQHQANRIYINSQAIPYVNAGEETGQSIINADPYGTAATWGGVATFSGTDGKNTHFIGHNPGIFAAVFKLNVNDQVQVTDQNNQVFTYQVTAVYDCDDNSYAPNGEDLYDRILSEDGGERVTFQACISKQMNRIVFASL